MDLKPAKLSRTLFVALALVCISALAIAPAAAQSPATQPAKDAGKVKPEVQIRRWFSDLASPDAAVRQQGRWGLLSLGRDQLPVLRKIVEQDRPLAPSQTVLLRQIVQEVYLAGEPYKQDEKSGFMGILMNARDESFRDLPIEDRGTPGIVVVERMPGFCAARMLQDGDVILGTKNPNIVFHNTEMLKAAATTVGAGHSLELQVLRDGRIIDVPIVLSARPLAVDSQEAFHQFKAAQIARFDEYWRQTFAPLLKAQVG